MLKFIKKNSQAQILILDKLDKNFKPKRIFFLLANKKVIRGNHAHKKCTQAFFSVKGSFLIECISPGGKIKKIIVKPEQKIIVIKPLTWVKVHLSKNDICGVICDRYYEKRDYIHDVKKFNEIKNKI
jgi:dTDP-4-dehydrorhamnose 3,5-epimerase-like enzyme